MSNKGGDAVDRLDRQARRAGCRIVTQEALDAHARTAKLAEDLQAEVDRLEQREAGLLGQLKGEQRRAERLLKACNDYRAKLERRSLWLRLTSRLRSRHV